MPRERIEPVVVVYLRIIDFVDTQSHGQCIGTPVTFFQIIERIVFHQNEGKLHIFVINNES